MEQVTPAVVIGLGEAGWRITNDMVDVVSEQLGDAAEAFEYITIDSSWNDMEAAISDEIYPLRLEMPEDYEFESDRDEFAYLSEQMDLATGTGAGQLRPIGRYHMEKKGNRANIRQRLEDLISQHVTDIERSDNEYIDEPEVVDVWVVNALGGGTGSGIFPIVASMLQNQLRRTLDAELRIMGIGGTPELNIPHDVTAPVYAANQRINAYTALRELEALLGYKREQVDELAIEHEERPDDVLGDAPFEKYFLLGHGQDESSENSLAEINRVAGALVVFWSLLEAVEDFPDNAVPPISKENRLYAVDGHEVHVPVGKGGSELFTIEDITEKLDRLRTLGSEVDDLKGTRSEVATAATFIETLLEADLRNESPAEIAAESPVSETLLRSLRQEASSVTRKTLVDHETEEQLFDFDETVDGILGDEDLLSTIPSLEGVDRTDDQFRREVVRYLYAGYLVHQIDEHVKDGHPFYEDIANAMTTLAEEKNYEAVQYESESPPFYQFDDPVTAYNNAVSDFYDQQARKLEEAVEESGGLLSDLSDMIGQSPAEKLEEIEAIQQKHRRKHRIYTAIRDIENAVDSEQTAAELTLEGIHAELDDRRTALTEQIRERNRTRDRDRRDIRHAITRINEDRDRDRYHRLGVRLPEDAQLPDSIDTDDGLAESADSVRQIYDTNGSIADLVENGHVDLEQLTSLLETVAANRLADPPLQNERQDEVANILGFATAGENFPNTDRNPLRQKVAGERTLDETLDSRFQYHNMNDLQTGTDNGFTIWSLGLYTDLDLDAMYEYSHIHEYFSDPERDTEDSPLGHYNPDVSDAEVRRRFAYPELLDG